MNNLPNDDIINEILLYLEIKCHSCYNRIDVNNLKDLIKLNKFYYCNKTCFNFI